MVDWGGVVKRRELKSIFSPGIGLIMKMYRAENKMLWRRMGDWRYTPTHSYLGIKRRRTVSIAPNR